jgi:hypothetical protein
VLLLLLLLDQGTLQACGLAVSVDESMDWNVFHCGR